MKITTFNQLQAGVSRVNNELKNYIRSIQETANGILFIDGFGNTVYSLPVLKSDPQLSISSNALSLSLNSSSDITVTRLGDGAISVTFIDGSDCAVATVSNTTVSFSGENVGTGVYKIDLASTSEYTASSDTVTVSVEEYAEEEFWYGGCTASASNTQPTINVGESDTVTVKTNMPRAQLPYHTCTLALFNAPSWVTMDNENSFYTDYDGVEKVQRVIGIAVPSDAQAGSVTFVVQYGYSYKVRNSDGSVSDSSDSADVDITVNINIPTTPNTD